MSTLASFIEKAKTVSSFEELDFSDFNARNNEGEGLMHLAVGWGDLEAAAALLAAGVTPNQPGDLGMTPLHIACLNGNLPMVKLLVDGGADPFSLNEGSPPFYCARSQGHDEVCEYLAPVMRELQDKDPDVWSKSRVVQLKAEIKRIESRMEQRASNSLQHGRRP